MNHLEIYYDDAEFRTIICPDFLSKYQENTKYLIFI